MVEEVSPIKPKTAAFLRKALPKREGGHMLVLGESHDDDEHLDFLRTHLATLQREHNLGTIGLELPPYLNVFFGAYQDGTLARELGSKHAAREYLTAMFQAYGDSDYSYNAIAKARLTIAALDAGLRVTAYDGRDRLKDCKSVRGSKLKALDKAVKILANAMKTTTDEVYQRIRGDSGESQYYFIHNKKFKFPLMLREVDHWLNKEPKYQTRLADMEKIITLGHNKEIGADAISAALLSATADATKNTLSIGGAGHINAMGSKDPDDNIQGTLPHHLRNIVGNPLDFGAMEAEARPAPEVTAAILAGTGMAKDLIEFNRGIIFGEGPYAKLHRTGEDAWIVRGKPIVLIKLDPDRITVLDRPKPEDSRYRSLEVRFGSKDTKEASHTPLINPLRDPKIRNAIKRVVEDWNGGETPPRPKKQDHGRW